MLNNKRKTTQPILNINLNFFVYWGLIFLLFYPPFFRGLFFPAELLMTHMYTAVIFALCWYNKLLHKDTKFFNGFFDYAGLAFVLIYGISLIGAVNMRGAVGEFLKVINYFMVFWITAQTIKSMKQIRAVYKAIYISAMGVAIVGISVAMGFVEYPGALDGNIILSTLQYKNTTAIFLSLGSILGLILLNQSQSKFGKMVYGAGNTLLVAVIVSSQSRGSWMLYPIVLLLFLIGLPRGYRFPTLYNLVLSLGVGLQMARVLQPRILDGTAVSSLKYILLGIAFSVGAQWAYDFAIRRLDSRGVRDSTRRLIGAGVIVYALIVFVVYIVYTAQAVPSVSSQFAPSVAVQKAQSMSNQDFSYLTRVDFIKASLKMAADYPINGLGGEGWNALYHRYMPYLFYSSETHSYPAKVLIETGVLGFVLFLGIWIIWGRNLYRLWRSRMDEDRWALYWAGGVVGITLGIHSLYDFDLSLGAMGIILWCLWGIVKGGSEVSDVSQELVVPSTKRLWILAFAGTIGAALLFLPSASLYTAGVKGNQGALAMTKQNWPAAEEGLLMAAELDPFSASYSADLAQIYTIKGMMAKDASQIALSDLYIKSAINLEPYNYQMRQRMLLITMLSGRVEQAVKEAESLVEQNPLDGKNYEILAKVYISAGRFVYEQGNKEQARGYWRKTAMIKELLAAKANESNPIYWDGAPLKYTSTLKLFEAEGAYLLGDDGKAKALLTEILKNEADIEEPLRVEAKLYLSAVKAKVGKVEEAQREINQLAKSFPGISKDFERLMKIKPK